MGGFYGALWLVREGVYGAYLAPFGERGGLWAGVVLRSMSELIFGAACRPPTSSRRHRRADSGSSGARHIVAASPSWPSQEKKCRTPQPPCACKGC